MNQFVKLSIGHYIKTPIFLHVNQTAGNINRLRYKYGNDWLIQVAQRYNNYNNIINDVF